MSQKEIVDALVVGRTKKWSHVCVGALDVATGESLRLLTPNGDPPIESPWHLGNLWRLEVSHSPHRAAPFVEDVVVHRQKPLGDDPSPRQTIESLVEPWSGDPSEFFDGALSCEGGKYFLGEGAAIPHRSTWFWNPPSSLHYSGGRFYGQFQSGLLDVKHVGFQDPRDLTPNDLVRVSLAYWWSGDYFVGQRCYLQLSGWF